MSDLITRVAEMTGQRDRNQLEISVAEVLLDALGAQRIEFWRVLEHRAGTRARLLVGLRPGEAMRMSDPSADAADCPRLDDIPGVRESCRAGTAITLGPGDDAGHRQFFPLLDRNEVCAVLEVERARPLDAHDERLVNGILRIYRNHLALLDYGEYDTLTGLLNRKTFERDFAQRISARPLADDARRDVQIVGRRRVCRPGDAPWLAIADVDLFKQINDRFGHVYGDEVLLLLARLMRSTFRSGDTLYRFGGEEFAVLLSWTDAPGAHTALERFRRNVEQYRFPQVGTVTLSAGYCRVTDAVSPIDAYGRADAALYYAKQHGRNQARCYDALVEEGALQGRRTVSGDFELF